MAMSLTILSWCEYACTPLISGEIRWFLWEKIFSRESESFIPFPLSLTGGGWGEGEARSLCSLSPVRRLTSVRVLKNRFHAAMRTNIWEGLACWCLIFQVRLYIDNFIVTDTACRGQTAVIPCLRALGQMWALTVVCTVARIIRRVYSDRCE